MQEVWSVRREGEVKVGGLEAQLHEARLRLEGYEKVEKELDDIVMQSAQCKTLPLSDSMLCVYSVCAVWCVLCGVLCVCVVVP